MDSLLRSQLSQTIDMKSLQQKLPSYVRVVTYDALSKQAPKTLKEAMGKQTVLILLFNVHSKQHMTLNVPGHFFVISVRGPEPCVVFSSTGMTPKKELFITHSDPALLTRILPKGTIYNNVKFQISRDSNTCWRWNILFARLATMGLKKFQTLFKRPVTIHNPDLLAVAFTFLL